MSEPARMGLFGKHPAFGDFLQAGLSRDCADMLGRWLDPTLTQIRADVGGDWDAFWREGQSLRFRIGRKVTGRSLTGVFQPSRDKVGRDYPLIVAAQGAEIALPGQAGDTGQGFWEHLESHLLHARAGQGAASLLAGLAPPLVPEPPEPSPSLLSAHHPEGKLDALLRAAARADAQRATEARSYWWAPATRDRLPVWLACNGLPDAGSLRWLIDGMVNLGEPHAS